MIKVEIPLFCICLLAAVACDSDSGKQSKTETPRTTVEENSTAPVFELVSPYASNIDFLNSVVETDTLHALLWDALYSGTGVAIGDLDNDGLPDLVFTGNQVEDRIYKNNGGLSFEDVTTNSGLNATSGWSTGASLCDVNSDGLLDIYICRSNGMGDEFYSSTRNNQLYINQGNWKFEEQAEKYGIADNGYSTQGSWFDFDKDGDLDLFVLNSPSNNLKQKIDYSKTGMPAFASDKLYRNDGDTFTEIGKSVGIAALSYGLGVVTADLNHDGWTDIYVANDYERPDYLYINQRDGTFKNELNDRIKHTSFTAMGVDANDINNDALIDLGVLDMQSESHYRSKTNMPSMDEERFFDLVDRGYNYQYMSNTLQLNHGYGMFSDIAQMAGMASTDWSWSILIQDYNNDSHCDIFISNGINKDIRNNDFADHFQSLQDNNKPIDLLQLSQDIPSTKLPNYLLEGYGELGFNKSTGDWGLDIPSFSFGAAHADLDRDGDLDLIVCNNEEEPFLFKNNSSNNWLRIQLKGDALNPDGLGAKAIIYYQGEKQYRENLAVRGYQSASEPIIHFGLGKVNRIDSLLVLLPSGKSIKQLGVKTNQTLEIDLAKATQQKFDVYGIGQNLFAEQTAALDLKVAHQENTYNDWEREILLPHKQSRMGGKSLSADFDGDGVDDLWFGGAAGQAASIHLQGNAGFTKSTQPAFAQDKAAEDVSASALDVDSDGDLDLYVCRGSGQWAENAAQNQDALYLNDGKGKFSNGSNVAIANNAGACVAGDFDEDGDLDLVSAGRSIPGQYPQPSTSFTLVNNSGTLVPAEQDDTFSQMGMVSALLFEDFYPEMPGKELLAVGEWMSPTFFRWEAGKWLLIETDLGDLSGWWFGASTCDVNGDGLVDIALGNLGINSKYHPSVDEPLKVYSGDLDNNGSNDIVLAKTFEDRYVPVRGRECSSEQLPFIAKEFEEFEEFATASIEEILAERKDQAYYKEAKDFRSGVLINENGSWAWQPFPNLAQISTIMALEPGDYNKDGKQDLLIAGNLFEAEVETTRHDASNGLVLLGDGNGQFQPLDLLYSGFYAPGNVRHLTSLRSANGGALVVVSNNNNAAQVFSHR